MAFVFFCQNILLAGTDIWSERKKQASQPYQTASLPVSDAPTAFPAIAKEIPDLGFGLSLKKGAAVPSWIASAVAPFASIQDIHIQKNPRAKTVLLLQDAHLHTEAQFHIAKTIEALARETKVMVAMEGAAAGKLKLSAYGALDTDVLRRTAEGLARVHVLNGAELAAIGYRADVDLFGVETETDYNDHVNAILKSRPLKPAAEKNIDQAISALSDQKKMVLSPELQQFDANRTAYEDGSLGLPAYVLYLDSIVNAPTPNLRDLIAASLLEGSIDFKKVEAERAEMVRVLAGRLSQKEIRLLTQLSAFFRSGHVSYSGYYNHLRSLAEKHDVSFSKYPEMNLYVQYVLKSEAIDHAALFAEISALENNVTSKLVKTPEQRRLLAASRHMGLSKKLIDFTLTEAEWAAYESLANSQWAMDHDDRLVFEDFYRAADRRNNSISENLATQLRSSKSSYAVLVAGGFHSQELLKNLNAAGFNTVLLSPKITSTGEGLSSLDVLASGRLPLDRLFAGEKLFIPTPPASSTKPAMLLDAIQASVEAGGKLLSDGGHLAKAVVGRVAATASRAVKGKGAVVEDDRGGRYEVTLDDGEFQGAYFLKPFSWPRAFVRHLINHSALRKEHLETFLHTVMGTYQRNGKSSLMHGASDRGKNIFIDDKKRSKWIQDVSNVLPHLAPFLQMFQNGLPSAIDLPFLQEIEDQLIPLFVQNKQGTIAAAMKYTLGFRHYRDQNTERKVRDRVKKVMTAFGISGVTLQVVLLDGYGLKTYAQVVRAPERSTHYSLRVSREFLNRFVFNEDMIREVMMAGGLSYEEAESWLIYRFVAHELAEVFLRNQSAFPGVDRALRADFHGLLVRNGFGWELPRYGEDGADTQKISAFINTSVKDRMAALVQIHPSLFSESAVQYFQGKDHAASFLGKPFSLLDAVLNVLRADVQGDAIVETVNIILKTLFPHLYPSTGDDPLVDLLKKEIKDRRTWAFNRAEEIPPLQGFVNWLTGFNLRLTGPGKAALMKLFRRTLSHAMGASGALSSALVRHVLGMREVRDGAVARDAKDALNAVLGQFRGVGFEIEIEIFDGKGLENLGDVVRVDHKYVIRASVEFLKTHVYPDSLVEKLLFKGFEREEAVQWLLERFIAHEIMESVFRRTNPESPNEDQSSKNMVHKLLVTNGFGKSVAVDPFPPLRDRLWKVLNKNPFLFTPDAIVALSPSTDVEVGLESLAQQAMQICGLFDFDAQVRMDNRPTAEPATIVRTRNQIIWRLSEDFLRDLYSVETPAMEATDKVALLGLRYFLRSAVLALLSKPVKAKEEIAKHLDEISLGSGELRVEDLRRDVVAELKDLVTENPDLFTGEAVRHFRSVEETESTSKKMAPSARVPRGNKGPGGMAPSATETGKEPPPTVSAAGPLVNWKDKAMSVLREPRVSKSALNRLLNVMEHILSRAAAGEKFYLAPFSVDNTRMLSRYEEFRKRWLLKVAPRFNGQNLKAFFDLVRAGPITVLSQPVVTMIDYLDWAYPAAMEVGFRQVLNINPNGEASVQGELNLALLEMQRAFGLSEKHIEVVMANGDAGEYLEMKMLPPAHPVREYYPRTLGGRKDQPIYLIEVGGGIYRKRWVLKEQAQTDVGRRAGWTERNASDLGRHWQHKAGISHELVEMFFTKAGATAGETEINRLAVHEALIETGIGIDVPDLHGAQAREFFDTPLAVHVARLIHARPELFNESALRFADTVQMPAVDAAPDVVATAANPALVKESMIRAELANVLKITRVRRGDVRINLKQDDDPKKLEILLERKQSNDQLRNGRKRVFEWWFREKYLDDVVFSPETVALAAEKLGSDAAARTWLLQNRIAQEVLAHFAVKRSETLSKNKDQLRRFLIKKGFGTSGFKSKAVFAKTLEQRIREAVRERPDFFDRSFVKRFAPRAGRLKKQKLPAWSGENIGAALMGLLKKNDVSSGLFRSRVAVVQALYAQSTRPWSLIEQFLKSGLVDAVEDFLGIKTSPVWGDSWIGGKGHTFTDELLTSLGFVAASRNNPGLLEKQSVLTDHVRRLLGFASGVSQNISVRLLDAPVSILDPVAFANLPKQEIVISLPTLLKIEDDHGRDLMSVFYAAASDRGEKIDQRRFGIDYFRHLARARFLAHEIAHIAGVDEPTLQAHYLGPRVPGRDAPDAYRKADFFSEAGVMAEVNKLIAEAKARAAAREPDTTHGRGYPVDRFHAWYEHNVGADLVYHIVFEMHAIEKLKALLHDQERKYRRSSREFGLTVLQRVLSALDSIPGPETQRDAREEKFWHLLAPFGNLSILLGLPLIGPPHPVVWPANLLDELFLLAGLRPMSTLKQRELQIHLQERANEILARLNLPTKVTVVLLDGAQTAIPRMAFADVERNLIFVTAQELERLVNKAARSLFVADRRLKRLEGVSGLSADLKLPFHYYRPLAVDKWLLHEILHIAGVPGNVLSDHYLGQSVPNAGSFEHFQEPHFFSAAGLIEEGERVLKARAEADADASLSPITLSSMKSHLKPTDVLARVQYVDDKNLKVTPLALEQPGYLVQSADGRLDAHVLSNGIMFTFRTRDGVPSTYALTFEDQSLEGGQVVVGSFDDQDGAHAVTLFPDGGLLFLRFEIDGETISIGEETLPSFPSHTAISAVSLSVAGRFLAAVSQSGEVFVVDLNTKKIVSRLDLGRKDEVTHVAVSANGAVLAVVVGSDLSVWRVASQAEIFKRVLNPREKISGLSVSADGQRIAFVSGHSNEIITEIKLETLGSHPTIYSSDLDPATTQTEGSSEFHGWYAHNVGAALLEYLLFRTENFQAFRQFLGELLRTSHGHVKNTDGWALITEFLHVSSTKAGPANSSAIFDRLKDHFDNYFDDLFGFDQAARNWKRSSPDGQNETIFDKLLELIGVRPDSSEAAVAIEAELNEAGEEIQKLFPELTEDLFQEVFQTPDDLSDFAFVFVGRKNKQIYYSAKELLRIKKEHGAALLQAYKEVVGTKKIKDESALAAQMEKLALQKFVLHEALHGMGASDEVLRDHYLGVNVPNKRSLPAFRDKKFFTLNGLIDEAKAVARGRRNRPSLPHVEKVIPIEFKKGPYRVTSAASWDNNEMVGVDWDEPFLGVVFPGETKARVQKWELPEEPSANVLSAALSPLRRDGSVRLALGHKDGHISIWEFTIRQASQDNVFVKNKRGIRVVRPLPLPAKKMPPKLLSRSFGENHRGPVESMYFSFSGSELASVDKAGNVFFWDVNEGRIINRYRHNEPVNEVRLFEDGGLAVFSTATGIYAWRPASGALVYKRRHGPNDDFRIITIDSDTSELGIIFVRDGVNMSDVWNLRALTLQPIYTFQQFYPQQQPQFTPMVAGQRFFHLLIRRLWRSIRAEEPHSETSVRDAALHAPKPKTRRYAIARFLEEILSVLSDHDQTPGNLRAEFRHEIKKAIRILRQAGRILAFPKNADRHERRSKRDLVRSKLGKLPHQYEIIEIVSDHFLPLFHGIPAVADKIQTLAGFRKIDHAKPFGGLHIDAVVTDFVANIFETSVPVSLEILSDSQNKIKRDFVFTERILLGEEVRVVIYVAEAHLLDILSGSTWNEKKEAFQFFLLRKLAHELLGISYAELEKIGLEKRRPNDAKSIPELVDALRQLNPTNPMLARLKDVPSTVEAPAADVAGPVSRSYYGNNPLQILVENKFADPIGVQSSLSDLIARLQYLPNRIHSRYWSPLKVAVDRLVERLDELKGAQRYFTFPNFVSHVVEAALPLFNSSRIVADMTLLWAGLDYRGWKDYSRNTYWQDQAKEFVAAFSQYTPGASVEFELDVRTGHKTYENHDLAFVQRFDADGFTKIIVRTTESSLWRILDNATKVRLLASQAGVRLSVEESEKLAFHIFLAHELGESLLGLSHDDLARAGIGHDPQAFVSTEGLMGALFGLAQMKNKTEQLQQTRQGELNAVALLGPAKPILKQIFQTTGHAAQYGAQFNAWAPYYDGNGETAPESLILVNYYRPEQTRLAALPEFFSKGARPAADVYRDADTANANAFMIFDQDGGYKDLADQYAQYLADENRKSKGPFVVGALEGLNNFTNKVMNYYGYVSGSPTGRQTKPGASSIDVARAKRLMDDLRNSNPSLRVVTLTDEMEASLKTAGTGEAVNVTTYVSYLKQRALELNPGIQRVILISDWRKLMVEEALKAITTVIMNLNLFIKVEDRIELETVAAIQA